MFPGFPQPMGFFPHTWEFPVHSKCSNMRFPRVSGVFQQDIPNFPAVQLNKSHLHNLYIHLHTLYIHLYTLYLHLQLSTYTCTLSMYTCTPSVYTFTPSICTCTLSTHACTPSMYTYTPSIYPYVFKTVSAFAEGPEVWIAKLCGVSGDKCFYWAVQLSIPTVSSVKTQLICCQLKWRHVSTQGVIIRPIIEPCLRYIKWKCTFLVSQSVYYIPICAQIRTVNLTLTWPCIVIYWYNKTN